MNSHLDIVSLSLESQIPLFLTDLDNTRVPLLEGSRAKPPEVPLMDVFALYRRTKTLLSMHAAFCPKYAHLRADEGPGTQYLTDPRSTTMSLAILNHTYCNGF